MSPALRPADIPLPSGNPATAPPMGLRWRSSRWFIVSTVGMAIFTDMVLYCLLVPVLPFMLQDRIHVPPSEIQTQVSSLLAIYAAAAVISSPMTGLLANRWSSRRTPFLLGLAALLTATVLLALGQTVVALVAARALQGLSAAVVWVLGLALLVETVGSDSMGAIIGSIYSLMTVGGLISPVLGGLLYRETGYTGVFGVSIAIVTIDFVMRVLVLEPKVARQYEHFEEDSAKPSFGSSSTRMEGAPLPDSTVGEQTPLLGHRISNRHLSRESFVSRHVPILLLLPDSRLLVSFLVGFVQALLCGTFDSTLPVAAKEFYGFNSLRAGLLFLSLGSFDLVMGPLAGWAVDRFSPRVVATVGYSWLAIVLALFQPLARPGGGHELAVFCVLLSLCGIGMAIANAPSLVEASLVVDRYHRANPGLFGAHGPHTQLYGLSSMIWSLGLAVGPLVAGFLKTCLGYGSMMTVMAVMSAVTAVLAFAFMGRKGDGDGCEEEADGE